MGILDSAGDIAAVLTQMAKERANGRVAEAGVNQNQGRAEADIYRTTMDAALKGPEQSARATALGDTMANIKPFAFDGVRQVGNIPVVTGSGGLTPANFGPATRQAGADLARVSGARVASPAFNLPAQPKLAPLPQASALDGILSTAGAAGSLAKAGAPGSGSGGDIGKLAKDIAKWVHERRNGQWGGDAMDSQFEGNQAGDNIDWSTLFDSRNADGGGLTPNVSTSEDFRIPTGPYADGYIFPNDAYPAPPSGIDGQMTEEELRRLQEQQGGGGSEITGSYWGDD